MKYFDTHTHLNDGDFTAEEIEQRIAEIEASDVAKIVDIGFDVPSSKLAVEHAKRLPWCYAAVGVHPHDTDHMTEDDFEEIKRIAIENKFDGIEAAKEPSTKKIVLAAADKTQLGKVVAIGEIGLDYHYDKEWEDKQKYWFKRQIELANELALPISVHSREADQDTLDILVEAGAFSEKRKSLFNDNKPHVVIHCYSGSAEFAKQYVKLGAMLGVDGPLTYKNNKKTVEVVATVPLENLLIETDAPYLTPVPHRGEPNRSPYVSYVAEKVAEIKGLTADEVARKTFANAVSFFNIEG